MQQKSDVEYRAEKLYKNSREKFSYLIRETVSNSIHSTIIKMQNEPNQQYIPEISVSIQIDDQQAEIIVKDNGEGFTELNRKYFSCLDTINIAKEKLNLHPQGQGRRHLHAMSRHDRGSAPQDHRG